MGVFKGNGGGGMNHTVGGGESMDSPKSLSEIPKIRLSAADCTIEGGGRITHENAIVIKTDIQAIPAILKIIKEENIPEDKIINDLNLSQDFFVSLREGKIIDMDGYNRLLDSLNINYDAFKNSKRVITTIYNDKSGKVIWRREGRA